MSNETVMKCDGWWEQDIYGRQSMDNLQLTFHDKEIEGSGIDIIGTFSIFGNIDDNGEVMLRKHYHGKHNVNYFGNYDGEGTMSGLWNIDGFGGSWLIRFHTTVGEITNEIQTIVPNQ